LFQLLLPTPADFNETLIEGALVMVADNLMPSRLLIDQVAIVTGGGSGMFSTDSIYAYLVTIGQGMGVGLPRHLRSTEPKLLSLI
jgi:hypothetical protein